MPSFIDEIYEKGKHLSDTAINNKTAYPFQHQPVGIPPVEFHAHRPALQVKALRICLLRLLHGGLQTVGQHFGAVCRAGSAVDLSKYFDTLNHELLMNLIRKNVTDTRVIELIKRYLKAGVMENGLRVKTTEGSPQGGPLSPLLANIYLNEYDQEMAKRGVPVIRYADDVVVLAKSPRAAQRLLETTQRYLEGKLKLKMNVDKSKVVSVYSIRNFKFLGFALGRGKNGVYIRAHAKSLKKAKTKLKELTSRSQGRNVRQVMENVKVYIRGWLGYFWIADMKSTMQRWDEWLRRRFRVYIWKQWKVPSARIRNLMKLGIPKHYAYKWGYVKAYWNVAGSPILQSSITNERLARAGYYSLSDRYESLHLCD